MPIPQGLGLTLDGVAESLRDAFFLTDCSGNLVYVCPLLAEVTGNSPEGMIGKNITDFLRQDKVEHFLALRDRLLAGEALQVEWELPDHNGNPVYLKIHLAPWRRGEEVVGVVGVAWDITEAILGERQLEKKALLLRLQMEVLECLAKADGTTEILRVIVDKTCDALGMEAGCLAAIYRSERGWLTRQIIQTRWLLAESGVAQWNELPGRDMAEAMEKMEVFSLQEGEGPQEWLETIDCKLGLVTPVLSSPRGAFVLIMISREEREWHDLERDFLGGMAAIAGQALQRAELVGSLRQSEESYINLADSVGEAIAIVQAEKVVFANQAMASLMGYADPGEMLGSSLDDFLLPDSLEDLRAMAKEKDLMPGKMRLRLRRRQGQEFVTDVAISHLSHGSRRAYQVMVTGAEGLQDQGSQIPLEFMSRLSHDFRTPLASVIGFADILEKSIGPERSPRVEECLGGIKRGMHRLNRLVDNMLTLTKVQAAPKEGWAYPSRVLEAVLEDFRKDIRDGEIKVVTPRDLPRVPVPESELQEIFQNLFSNAIRAVHGVENPHVTVDYEFSKQHHLFSVQDNGVGIPEEHQESIFQPLFRLVPGEEGSGLGLSIVHQILRAHGGDIWVKSSAGRGTTFYFSIPAP